MTTYSKSKLAAAQDDLWLAEIEREDEGTLVVTLAGPGRIVMLECSGLGALCLAHESLDPEVLAKDLRLEDALELSKVTEFDPEEEIPARLTEVSTDQADDILCAAKQTWLDGDIDQLKASPLLLDLRVESWRLAPHPVDLHLLVACDGLVAAEENGEIDLTCGVEPENHHHDEEPPAPYTAPEETAFDCDVGDFPEGIGTMMKSFFEAGLSNDYATLARLVQNFDMSDEEQEAYFAEHFHSLFDWYYARAVESYDVDDRLACVRVRGIIHSREEDGISAINEECVWSFSLRKTEGGWVIRNWSTSWPSVGGAPMLSDDEKPWLANWKSGPVT